MHNVFIKFLRFIFFIPLCMLTLGLVNWGLVWLFIWFIGLSKFWMIVVFFVFASTIWNLFTALAVMLTALTSYVSPNRHFGVVTISILSIINGAHIGYRVWTLKDAYSGWEITGAIFVTILLFELTLALIHGALAPGEGD